MAYISVMETIRDGFKRKLKFTHRGDQSQEFASAVLSLYDEFHNSYTTEWERLNDDERVYLGDHWTGMEGFGKEEPNTDRPRPSTPIITSTIENIKADLFDQFPVATIDPDLTTDGGIILSKVLTMAVNQDLDECKFESNFAMSIQDFVQDGWTVWETGWDPFGYDGMGSSYIRYISNKNFLCDPLSKDLQNGRAVFKIDRRPRDWFAQRYPDAYPYMGTSDELKVTGDHFQNDSNTKATDIDAAMNYLEAWFRIYDVDAKKYQIHFVTLAGGLILENSSIDYPSGYYSDSLYPFVITRFYARKDSALGFGIVELFKNPQRYSDKLDQILLENAFRASRPRMIVNEGIVDIDDARDWTKEVISTQGPAQKGSAYDWMQTAPLPAYLMNYIQNIRDGIKQESGANDQSRGQTGGGVTAASAITALQEMATKRSRMEVYIIFDSFRECVKRMISVLRDRAIVTRTYSITVNGQPQILPFDRVSLLKLGGLTPLGFLIDVKTSRQTRYSRLSHNELWLQMMNMMQQSADPVIMLEGLDFDEKEKLLDCVRRAQQGGMLNLQKQLMSAMQTIEQLQAENAACRESAAKAQAYMNTQAQAVKQGAQADVGSPIKGSDINIDPAAVANAM